MNGALIFAVGFISLCLGVVFAFAAAVVVAPIVMFCWRAFYAPSHREEWYKEAIEKGHVVEAHLKKTYHDTEKIGDEWRLADAEIGVYVYSVDGKKGKIHIGPSWHGFSPTITLYYWKNPRKATTPECVGYGEIPWFKIYLLTALVLSVLITVALFICIILMVTGNLNICI